VFYFCAEPPTAPQNLSAIFVDQSTVSLAWQPPHFQGGRGDTVYRVVCDACGLGVSYSPSSVSIGAQALLLGRPQPPKSIISLLSVFDKLTANYGHLEIGSMSISELYWHSKADESLKAFTWVGTRK
jgi:hypothetical protein